VNRILCPVSLSVIAYPILIQCPAYAFTLRSNINKIVFLGDFFSRGENHRAHNHLYEQSFRELRYECNCLQRKKCFYIELERFPQFEKKTFSKQNKFSICIQITPGLRLVCKRSIQNSYKTKYEYNGESFPHH
jgi:hypothetical protein